MTTPPSGAFAVCRRAPPSLHEDHVKRPCGEGALSQIADRASTVRVNGAGSASLPNASSSPGGTLASVTSVVRGFSRIVRVAVRPAASVAVSDSSRCDGYSWSGATKLPAATPT